MKIIGKIVLVVSFVLVFSINSVSQVGIGNASPNTNAMLDVDVSSISGTKKGFLPPRMTAAQKTTLGAAMGATEAGMLVFDTTNTGYYFWDGSQWISLNEDYRATGSVYITSSATTNLTVNTPAKVAGTTAASNEYLVTGSTSNRLTYNGSTTRIFNVNCAISAYTTGTNSNRRILFHIYKNGVIESSLTIKEARLRNNSNQGSMAYISGNVSMSNGDYIELWVENIQNSDDIVIELMNLSIH